MEGEEKIENGEIIGENKKSGSGRSNRRHNSNKASR